VYSSSSLVEQYGFASNQVQGAGYFKSEVETNMVVVELETDTTSSG
jgi:hypothetical protein